MKTLSLAFLILFITSANHLISQNKEAVKLFNSGYDAEKSGDPDNAIFFYNMAIDNDSKYADAYHRRGVVYYNMKNTAKANTDFAKALQLNPKHEGALMSIGQMNYDQKDYTSAITNFTSVIEINPGNAGAYMKRGDAYFITSDYNSAAADYMKTVELKPDHSDAKNMIDKLKTEYNVEIKQPEPPVTETLPETKSEEVATKTTYDGIVAEETKTAIETKTGTPISTEKSTETVTSNEVASSEVKTNEITANEVKPEEVKTETVAEVKEVKTETVAEVKEVKTEIPETYSSPEISSIELAEEHYQKGRVYTDAGNNFSAVKEYTEAIKLNPNHEKAYVNRGYVYCEMKNYDKAINDYEMALTINQNSVFAYYSLGAVYVNKGKKDQAAGYFRHAALLGDSDSKEWLKANNYTW